MRGAISDMTGGKAAFVAENALPRQQLIVLRRRVARPVVMPSDRVLRVLLARLARDWRAALLIVRPGTLPRWHRHGYRPLWRVRAATAAKRPRVSSETVTLIRRTAAENRLWGAERIRSALLKLGIRVGKRTVRRPIRATRSPRPHGQTWATFPHNRARDVWARDFLPVIDPGFRALFAFFRHRRARLAPGRPRRRDAAPDRCVGRPAIARGDAVWRGATVLDPRQRRHVRRAVRPRRGG